MATEPGAVSAEASIVLTVSAVAQRLGVAVPTLRSWDRRYGLGPSEHSTGGHRRYTETDLVRLRHMTRLTGEGVPPAAAARVALGLDERPAPARDGGGSGSFAVGRVQASIRGLAREAGRLDVDAVRRQLVEQINVHGVAATWTDAMVPLLTSIGEAYERDPERMVAVEHAASAAILRALTEIPRVSERGRLPALLASAPDEQHTLALEALAATLAEQGCPSRFLGARMPATALVATARRIRPTTLVLWAHTPRLARQVPLDEVSTLCEQVLLCGPGWDRVAEAADHHRPQSLVEAAQSVLEASGARP